MNLDHLICIGDVVPAAVSLPAISDDLYESAAERRIGNMGDASVIRFYVELDLSVFFDRVFLDVLHVDAGIFDGNVLIAAADFYGEAISDGTR